VNQADAYQLLHQGAICLAEVESNGMRIDVPYLDRTIVAVAARIKHLEGKLRGCKEYTLQRRRYGLKTSLGSRDQLAAVLFNDLGHEPLDRTPTGKPKLDEAMLERVGSRYTKAFLRLEKLLKLHGTYLLGVRREVAEDGMLHSFFGLHLVRSFRGQSDSPNLQNIPVRDPIQGKVIRQAFIPRDGHAIVEVDFSSLEVMVACALSGDPRLTYDATEGDMHRDMAAECYKLEPGQVTKGTRFNAKGGFVFSQFYGDWFKACAKNLWDGIRRDKLTTKNGQCLYDHLAVQGITQRGACDPDERHAQPGTFEAHIQAVENRFWNERFKVYKAWREAQVVQYKRLGYVDLVTGFRCHGPMSKNQVMNYPIQGPAFHCLLWSMIRLRHEIQRQRMGVKLICQIHDSVVADVPLAVLDDYLYLVNDITTRQLQARWDWITVPFKVEAEVATTNWWEKKVVAIPGAA